MADVARVAGVSLATVSRALNAPATVSDDLRLRVQAAADRLGYAPNPIAGGLAGNHTPLVGVVVPSLTNSFFAATLERMTTLLEAEGYQLMIGHHGYDLGREERIVTAFAGWNPSAIVLTGVDHSRGTVAALSTVDCPVVEMWDLDGRPLDSLVGFSNAEAGRMAGRFLAESGRRRVAFVCSVPDRDPRAEARARGFAEAHAGVTGAGGRVEIVAVEGRDIGDGGIGLQRVLERMPDVEAIAFSGDMLAVGAVLEAERRGLQVPRDLAIVGYGDLDIAAHTNPPLTTVRPPRSEIGEVVARHILKRLKDPASGGETVKLDLELVRRGSA
ncbi:LacI family DNA-binding transcriptional regulator [Tropicimonas sp. IMCC34043]|uniref:LacI family DNA-binding transcriptional regulator n=1 Tax=Tropicimonas sp. IMCC34043 TaxID=2248760 RepID=UPI0018E5575F|nr:LacI family DNA-binding transcriptional regulator [Tropicimonas sp. IMCC34043]